MALSKLRLGQLKPADGSTTVGDVHFPKVKWLSSFNGSNGATTTTDSSNSNLSLTIQSSSSISTAQSKFGGSSLYTPNSSSTGVYASGAGSTIQLTGDFTMEWWFYRVQATLSNGMVIGPTYGHQSVTNLSDTGLLLGYTNTSVSTTQTLLYASSSGSGWNLGTEIQLGTGSMGTVGQWVHFAFTRSGSDWSFYVNGTRTYNATVSSATIAAPGTYILLGKAWSTLNQAEGYYDDFRITQGLARYTDASFTVPTTAHLTSAGDVNKQIVVNSDADGVAIGTGGISQARIAKAWVNFNGTGTVAIRTSYNVSSITDDGMGKYDVNFSTAMTDNDYSVVTDGRYDTGDSAGSSVVTVRREALTASKFGVRGANVNTQGFNDFEMVSAIVFGN